MGDVHPIIGRLAAYRRAAGWSLRELSAKTGLSVQGLSVILNGQKQPGIGTLAKIADAFRLDIQLTERPDARCGEQGPYPSWVCNQPTGHRMPHVHWLNSVQRNAWEPVVDEPEAPPAPAPIAGTGALASLAETEIPTSEETP